MRYLIIFLFVAIGCKPKVYVQPENVELTYVVKEFKTDFLFHEMDSTYDDAALCEVTAPQKYAGIQTWLIHKKECNSLPWSATGDSFKNSVSVLELHGFSPADTGTKISTRILECK